MPDVAIEEGQLIAGKYRVERILGSGGMGIVVDAWHCELSRHVALKMVRPEAMARDDALTRFRREARVAARLRSEHVVRVMDVGVLDTGNPFMVMEFLEGHDLEHELVERGSLPVAEAVSIVLQVIDALAEAHSIGVVHRDLKPANLFLAELPDGSRRIKVLDFGVSKAGFDPADMSVTQDFTLIGSPLYMSPEQMRSARDVDARTDIWSLGVILFELVSGRPPYLESSVVELFRAMLEAPPSLREIRPEVPEALERIVARCLERYPGRRFADVQSLAMELQPLASDGTLRAPRPRFVLTRTPSTRDESQLAETTLASSGRHEAPSPADDTPLSWGQTAGKRKRRMLMGALILLGSAATSAAVLAFVLRRSAAPASQLTGELPHLAANVPEGRKTLASSRTIEQAKPALLPIVNIDTDATGVPAPALPVKVRVAQASRPRFAKKAPGPKARESAKAEPKAVASEAPNPSEQARGAPVPDFGGRR